MRKRLLSDLLLLLVVATESTREKLQRGTWNHLKALNQIIQEGKSKKN